MVLMRLPRWPRGCLLSDSSTAAEETIYIILCVHTGMTVLLRPNKREAVRKRGILCLSILVCSLFLTHKKHPYCYSTFLYMPPLSPSPFYTSFWLVSWSRSPEFLFQETPWPSHSPFCSLFLFQDTVSTRLFTFQPSCKIKSHSLIIDEKCLLVRLVLDIKKGISGQELYYYFVSCF